MLREPGLGPERWQTPPLPPVLNLARRVARLPSPGSKSLRDADLHVICVLGPERPSSPPVPFSVRLSWSKRMTEPGERRPLLSYPGDS